MAVRYIPYILAGITIVLLPTPGPGITSAGLQTILYPGLGHEPGVLYSCHGWGDPGGFPGRWQPFSGPTVRHLNPDGDARGDGEPDLGINPGTRRPEVVWARAGASGRTVVWARWTGTAWTDPLPLTDPSAEDQWPRLTFLPGGGTALAWQETGGRVQYREHPEAEGAWGETVDLTAPGETGGRPDLAARGDGVRVGYSLAEPDGRWSVVVETRVGPPRTLPSFVREVLSLSTFTADPEVRVEAQGPVLWTCWRQDPDGLAWSRREAAGWTPPERIPVADGDWEAARFAARRRAFRSR